MKTDRLDTSRAFLEGNMNAAFHSQLACSAGQLSSILVLQLFKVAPLSYSLWCSRDSFSAGPTIPAVMLKLITGRCLHGGRQHPHRQGARLGKCLGAPPMAHVSQLGGRYLRGALGCLCTAAPLLPALPPVGSKSTAACW